MQEKIIEAIDSELNYQERLLNMVGLSMETHIHSSPEWLLIIERTVDKAKKDWYEGNLIEVNNQFREIAATAVAAMSQCGIINNRG